MPSAAPAKSIAVVAADADAGSRLDVFLSKRVDGLTRSQAQRLIRDGDVRVDGAPAAKASLPVHSGLVARVARREPVGATPLAEALPLTILYDDPDIVVIDKPAGLVVHPAAGHPSGTLVNALLHHVGGLSGIGGVRRPGIVHRLDRGTSGVMIVAKHDRAHQDLARQFHDREVDKAYVALVWGTATAGATLDAPIGRHPRDRKKMSSRAARGRPALTRIESSEPLGRVSLVRLSLGTGRTHQIRVHLSESGHPVVGDALYGGTRTRQLPSVLRGMAAMARPFLHAAALSITHPRTGRRMTFESALPPDLSDLLARLRQWNVTQG